MNEHYEELYRRSMEEPKAFWEEAARELLWEEPWHTALAAGRAGHPASQWFQGGRLNITASMLDRHIDSGRGSETALVLDSPLQGGLTVRASYSDLLRNVESLAAALLEMGCGYTADMERDGESSLVLIYMPNGMEAVTAMLAAARVGAPHSVVFGGFSAEELAKRISHAQPRVIIASSCGLEPKGVLAYKPLLDQAIRLAGPHAAPRHCIIHQRPQCLASMTSRDVDWAEVTAKHSNTHVPPTPVPSSHPLYILYTSGTTGTPKGVVRDTGGYATALSWSMANIYCCGKGDVYWAASDVGWVVGHSYITYGPLLAGCTSVIYEGKPTGTPDAGAFWRVIQDNHVNLLFCAPTAFRAIQQRDPSAALLKKYDTSSLRTLFLAGERADANIVQWAEDILKKPVIDNYWQTETGWPIATNFVGKGYHQTKRGSTTKPVPGYDVRVLSKSGREAAANELGTICIKRPLPPGCMVDLWKDGEGMKAKYFSRFSEEYYDTGDAGHFDSDGYLHVMTRTGDIVNVAGHRLSTGGLEEVITRHPGVAECAVVGMSDTVKGQVPFPFLVLNDECTESEEEILAACRQEVRRVVGAFAGFDNGLVVDCLPKTRSGKILRRVLQSLVDGDEHPTVPATIDDPTAIDRIAAKMKK